MKSTRKSTNLLFSFICLFLLFAGKLPFAAEKPSMQLSISEAIEYMNILGYSIEELQSFGYTIDISESDWNKYSFLKPYSIEMTKYIACLIEKGPEQNRVSWKKDIGACRQQKRFEESLLNYACQSIASIKNSTIAMASNTGECEHIQPTLVQDNCKQLIQKVSSQNNYTFTDSGDEKGFRSCCESVKINYHINETTYLSLCWDTDPSTTHCKFLKREQEASEALYNQCFESNVEEVISKDYCTYFDNTNSKLYDKFCKNWNYYPICFYPLHQQRIDSVLPDNIPNFYYLHCIPMQLSPVFTIADLKKLEKEEHISWDIINQINLTGGVDDSYQGEIFKPPLSIKLPENPFIPPIFKDLERLPLNPEGIEGNF